MLHRRSLLGLLMLTLAATTTGSAHELKVLASQLAVEKPGGKVTIYLSWGHRLPIDDLIDGESLERYDLSAPAGTVTALKRSGLSLQANAVELGDAGVYQVLLVRKPSISTYIIDDEGRRVLRRGPKPSAKGSTIDSATRNQHLAKALIVVGPPSREPVKPAGLPLEIVPLDGPVAWGTNVPIRLQVLLNGKPLAAAELTGRYVGFKPDNAWCYSTTTDAEGVATVTPSQLGTWVFKASNKKLTTGAVRDEYDFESHTTTLALEVVR